MIRAITAAVTAVLAGCAHTSAELAIGGTAPGTGGATGSVNVRAGSASAALIAIGIFAGAAYAESRQAGVRYRANPFLALDPDFPRAAPPMDEARRVNEQDCTRPVADPAANLRCR
jgi:hypothetical protein